ncbi:MAG: lasso peptide biosynthesis B2 protein [Chloroflexi bacterium]|nr:lasso peptide biosynthesis B2 protein [Chloroflexota bacterium]
MACWNSSCRNGCHFRARPASERRQLLQALLLLSLVGVLRRVLRFSRLCTLLSRWAAAPNNAPLSAVDQMHHIAQAVQTASACAWPRPNCLDRSLTLWFMLNRRRITSELVFGVCYADGALDAHAWVTVQGSVLNDSPDVAERYAVIHPQAMP